MQLVTRASRGAPVVRLGIFVQLLAPHHSTLSNTGCLFNFEQLFVDRLVIGATVIGGVRQLDVATS